MIEKQMNIAELQAPILANQMLPALPLSETYMMDCVEGMKQYPDKWFDLAVVDPPYGIERFQKKTLNAKEEKDLRIKLMIGIKSLIKSILMNYLEYQNIKLFGVQTIFGQSANYLAYLIVLILFFGIKSNL